MKNDKKMELEIDMIVYDSVKAFELYKNLFDAESVIITNGEKGLNESIFYIADTKFHLLDENKEFNLKAPSENQNKSVWMNIIVDNIEEMYDKAIKLNCKSIQEILCVDEMNLKNAIVEDEFGYVWMFNQYNVN